MKRSVLKAAALIFAAFLAQGVLSSCGKETNTREMITDTIETENNTEEKDEIIANVSFNENLADITFKNDLGVRDIGDPFMLRVSENEYYMYCTSAPNGFYAWKSNDMIHWDIKKMCYVKKPDSWNADCFWAPEVIAYDGRYYMFYTAKNTEGSLRIGLAISDDPMGPFTDYENKPLFDLGYAAIDSNVFIDDDGSKYLYFSRDCSENIVDGQHISELYGVRLSDDLMSIEGEPIRLTTPTQAWEKPQGGWGWNEGPEMIKHNGKYYLTYSANYFESPYYSLGVAISDDPLFGFVKPDYNPILTKGDRKDVSGTGHHGFVLSPDESQIWMSYHSHTFVDNPTGNRMVNIAEVKFDEAGRIYVNGPTTCPQLRPSGNGVSYITDKFSASYLDNGNFKTSALITDGLFSVHGKDADLNETIILNEDGEGKIRLSSKEAETIGAIAIHFGCSKIPSGLSVRFFFDEKDYSDKIELSENDPETLIVRFNEVSAKLIDICFKADAKTSLGISEIQLIR